MHDISKVGGILIKDKKFLITRSKGKDFLIAPGGKREGSETPKQTLVRELKEELNIEVQEKHLSHFGSFEAPAAGNESKTIHMEVFLVSDWQNEIIPNNEIEEVLWITSSPPPDIKIGSIFAHEVLPRLKSQNLID